MCCEAGGLCRKIRQTISVSTLEKSYYGYKISCYLMTYPRIWLLFSFGLLRRVHCLLRLDCQEMLTDLW